MGSIPFISKEDERIKAGEFPPNSNHEEDCAGNWREHPQLRTRNASKSFHLSPGVNERIIAKALTDADYSPQVGLSEVFTMRRSPKTAILVTKAFQVKV